MEGRSVHTSSRLGKATSGSKAVTCVWPCRNGARRGRQHRYLCEGVGLPFATVYLLGLVLLSGSPEYKVNGYQMESALKEPDDQEVSKAAQVVIAIKTENLIAGRSTKMGRGHKVTE